MQRRASDWPAVVLVSSSLHGSDGGLARSTAEFSDENSFENWDFNEEWTIGEAPDGVMRPIFQWQE